MRKIKFVREKKSKEFAVLILFEDKDTAEYCADNIAWASSVVEVIYDE